MRRSQRTVGLGIAGLVSVAAITSAATLQATTHRGSAAAATLYVATNGSDSAPCTRARPCASFDRAYHRARSGARVLVAPGRYGEQQITPRSSPPTKAITFTKASKTAPSIAGLDITGSHVVFDRIRVRDSWVAQASAHHLAFRNMAVRGGFFINSASYISIVGGSVGPGVDVHSQIAASVPGRPPRSILIDRVRFHDFRRTSDGVHIECLQVGAAVGITIRRSRFQRCDVFDLSFTSYNDGGMPTKVVLENNVFGSATSGGYFSVNFTNNPGFAWRDVQIRYNTFFQAMSLPDPDVTTVERVVLRGNAGVDGLPYCEREITYIHNVWQRGVQCGSDRIGSVRFLSTRTEDPRLGAGSAAVDHGDPASYPRNDFLGRRRYVGKGPDAGAIESR